MHTTDRSCRYYIQDVFFWRLAGPVAPTGKAIEWSTRFASVEALLTIKSKTDAVFSPVKAPVLKVKSLVASVSKTPFFYPSVSGRSGPDQVPEGQQDFQMKSPLANLYGEASLEPEPLFSSTFGTPAGSAAGPEVDDREDISEGELLVQIQNFHRIRTIFKLRTSLIEKQ